MPRWPANASLWRSPKARGTSHRQFRHSTKKGTVTVNGHHGDTLPHWLVGSILKQAGLTKEDLEK
jgi:predicted RNA binding protein YcfA (HicA-like mRNA interferase family)